MNAKSMFSKGIIPNKRGKIEATSHELANLLTNSTANAKRKVALIEKTKIFFFDFFNKRKLTIVGGTKTIIIDKR